MAFSGSSFTGEKQRMHVPGILTRNCILHIHVQSSKKIIRRWGNDEKNISWTILLWVEIDVEIIIKETRGPSN
jgi:hypothetical protein